MLYYLTAGESHGSCLIAMVGGLPAGLPIDESFLNAMLVRRQGGCGRSERMELEEDRVEVLSGVIKGKTTGAPVAMMIRNKAANLESLPPVEVPRPGHADLAGALKLGLKDSRNVLERSSARETAARVGAGALAELLLLRFGIRVVGHVVAIGGVGAKCGELVAEEMVALRDKSRVYCCDVEAEKRMLKEIESAGDAGDTVGGVFEVVAFGVPAGLGSFAQWDSRLDGRLARALMAVQAIKAVEVGLGFKVAEMRGSAVHDEIDYDGGESCVRAGGYTRRSNNAGGIEGGVSNGQPIRVRAAMKPIPTLRRPLASARFDNKQKAEACYERSDVCAVPAASVVGEAVVAFELARAFMEKFGGDSVEETGRNFDGYIEGLRGF
jgi:chorismate synthase